MIYKENNIIMYEIPNFDEFLNEEAKYSSERSHSTFALQSFALRNQIHVWHWQCEQGDLHTALGDFYGGIIDSIDGIMEISMGKYGRIAVKGAGQLDALIDFADADLDKYLAKYVDIYNGHKENTFKKDADIQNKLDEVVADINKLRYLITLK